MTFLLEDALRTLAGAVLPNGEAAFPLTHWSSADWEGRELADWEWDAVSVLDEARLLEWRYLVERESDEGTLGMYVEVEIYLPNTYPRPFSVDHRVYEADSSNPLKEAIAVALAKAWEASQP